MKKKSFIVSLALILCFVCALANAADSSSASAVGNATQPKLFMQGSDIDLQGGELVNVGRMIMDGPILTRDHDINLQGGRVLNVSRIYFNSLDAAQNPPTNRDLAGKKYVDIKTSGLQQQINDLQNQINALSGGGGGGGSTSDCQPGYTLFHGSCVPDANFRP